MFQRALIATALACGALTLSTTAQTGVVSGLDIQYGFITSFDDYGDEAGVTGFAAKTTICNPGSVNIPWFAPMNENHPVFGFLACRDLGDRFEQISDRSYVKHPFVALSSSQCTPCTGSGGGTTLGIGCSDTYSSGLNASRYYLGPPEEIDPWLGEWTAVGSHFDRGVVNPDNPTTCCDGIRSLTNAQISTMTAAENMVRVKDEMFQDGGTFYYGGYIVTAGEAEALRDNNGKSRRFTVAFSGGTYAATPVGTEVEGVILNRWAARDRMDSTTNGTDDGRVYVAVKTSGPFLGLYHYEYAIQNRDNHRGVGSFTVPKCAGARVLNLEFKDVDDDSANDWTATVNATDVTFASNAGNGLYWNTIYNFSFDSDAAPVEFLATLGAQDPGAGANAFGLLTNGPGELRNVYLGDGCALDAPPALFTNKVATLGNADFKVLVDGAELGQPVVLFFSQPNGTFSFQGCDVYLGGALNVHGVATSASATGPDGPVTRAVFDGPIPNDVALEGVTFNLQAAAPDSAGGPILGSFELSNGLRIRIGDNLVDCP